MDLFSLFRAISQSVSITFVIFLVLGLLIVIYGLRIVPEYKRLVVFRLGRVLKSCGPGIVLIIPIIDRAVFVDVRTITMDVPPQEVITKDNVPIRVDAVVYMRVIDPVKAIVEIENHITATSLLAQTVLRSVLGSVEFEDTLSSRDSINMSLQKLADEGTGPWGIKISAVEIKEVSVPETMKRAMARQSEAERERRAKVIAAEGELQASVKLTQAAMEMEKTPIALQLRYLQTIREISGERNTTTFLPFPVEMLSMFQEKITKITKAPEIPQVPKKPEIQG